ncbi:MAG: hypothetical protein ACJ8BW_38745, partial [Ktedonobacteraceae bacterium]
RANSSGFAGLPNIQISCVGAGQLTLLFLSFLTTVAVFPLITLGKFAMAAEFMNNSSPKLKTSTNPADQSASRRRNGMRRFFPCRGC